MHNLCFIIDTSIAGTAIGLADLQRGEFLSRDIVVELGESDSHLQRLCQEQLQAHGLQFQDVEKIAVATGPGSFTGIKVGLAFCYGLKAAQDCAMTAFCGVQLAYEQLKQEHGKAGALLIMSTSTHGFLAGDNGCELVDLRVANALAAVQGLWVAENFTAAQQLLQAAQIPFSWVPLQQLASYALSGALQSLLAADAEQWSKITLPTPNYMRQPTVVEKKRGEYIAP